MLKHLDLCSGIGGFAVGFSMAILSEFSQCFCIQTKFCVRKGFKNFPNIPIYDDKSETADDLERYFRTTDGFSRQDICVNSFSTSGKGVERTPPIIFCNFPVHKLIKQVCVFENVYGHFLIGT